MDNSNIKKLLGTRVHYLRKLAGLSQEQLAEVVGLSTKTISYIENGKNSISLSKLPLLAKGLGVPVYKLFISADNDNSDKIEKLLTLLQTANEKEINAIIEIIKTVLAIK